MLDGCRSELYPCRVAAGNGASSVPHTVLWPDTADCLDCVNTNGTAVLGSLLFTSPTLGWTLSWTTASCEAALFPCGNEIFLRCRLVASASSWSPPNLLDRLAAFCMPLKTVLSLLRQDSGSRQSHSEMRLAEPMTQVFHLHLSNKRVNKRASLTLHSL